MSEKTTLKPLALALGAAFVTSLASIPVANAAENPFAMAELSSGYMVAEMAEGKCGSGMKTEEGKCGSSKKMEGKCGEGKCGMSRMDADGDGNVTKDEFMQGHEAMFSNIDQNADGMIDQSESQAQMTKMKEGKCGEGKCGAGKQ